MVLVTIRTAIIFIVLLVIMRLMGKRQIGEMQPFELVITLLIAELACIPMADVNKNGIDDYQLKRNNLDVSDLIESLRSAGYFSLDAVDYALYEANGTFSALPRQDYEELQTSLPLVIIDNGKYDKKNLEITGLEQSFFDDILKNQGVKRVKDVLVLTADGTGKIYLQSKKQKYVTFRTEYPGGKTW